MVISNFTRNLRGPWMMHPEQASVMLPVLKGVLQGYITELDKAPAAKTIRLSQSGSPVDGSKGTSNLIYVTHLFGTMLKYDYCEAPGTQKIARGLLDADANPDVIGHIIIADSGGGSSDSVAPLADAISKLTKPCIAYVDGMAASACMYAISYCASIMASNDMDRIGCIGTLVEISGYPQFVKQDDGLVYARIYADQSGEKNLDYEEALKGNAKLIKENLLNPITKRFQEDVKANRPQVKDEQLHGATYFAKDVCGSLIDSIGSFEDAVNEVVSLASKRQESNDGNQQNSFDMKNIYVNLALIASMADQVYAEDGSTTLQPNQLADIEAALEAGVQNLNQLQQSREELASIKAQLAELQKANETLTADNAKLQESLDAAIARANANADEDDLKVRKNAVATEDEFKGAQTYEEADAICRDFLKNRI